MDEEELARGLFAMRFGRQGMPPPPYAARPPPPMMRGDMPQDPYRPYPGRSPPGQFTGPPPISGMGQGMAGAHGRSPGMGGYSQGFAPGYDRGHGEGPPQMRGPGPEMRGYGRPPQDMRNPMSGYRGSAMPSDGPGFVEELSDEEGDHNSDPRGLQASRRPGLPNMRGMPSGPLPRQSPFAQERMPPMMAGPRQSPFARQPMPPMMADPRQPPYMRQPPQMREPPMPMARGSGLYYMGRQARRPPRQYRTGFDLETPGGARFMYRESGRYDIRGAYYEEDSDDDSELDFMPYSRR